MPSPLGRVAEQSEVGRGDNLPYSPNCPDKSTVLPPSPAHYVGTLPKGEGNVPSVFTGKDVSHGNLL